MTLCLKHEKADLKTFYGSLQYKASNADGLNPIFPLFSAVWRFPDAYDLNSYVLGPHCHII